MNNHTSAHASSPPRGWIQTFLKEVGYKHTKSRATIAEYVEQKKGVFCARDLTTNLPMLDRVTIYRTIELFQKLDIIHPAAVLDGEQYYETHTEDHHHHAVCTKCHRSEYVNCDYTDKPVPGFKETHHTVIVTGICYKCA